MNQDELKIVYKFYEQFINHIPDNKHDIWTFLESLSTYNKEKHYNDKDLEQTVSEIVDKYFQEKESLKDNINKRKEEMIEWIKNARDNEICHGFPPIYHHYDGGACSCSNELHFFYCHVFNHYYESIGTDWEYK
jgi:hypothetical protein